MADPPTEGVKDLYHDDQTLTKVRDLLMAAGFGVKEAEDIIRVLLNGSILFREFDINDTAPASVEPVTVRFEADGYPADSDHKVGLEELVFMALGGASMCWIGGTGNSPFDSIEATKIGNELCRSLRARGAR